MEFSRLILGDHFLSRSAKAFWQSLPLIYRQCIVLLTGRIKLFLPKNRKFSPKVVSGLFPVENLPGQSKKAFQVSSAYARILLLSPFTTIKE